MAGRGLRKTLLAAGGLVRSVAAGHHVGEPLISGMTFQTTKRITKINRDGEVERVTVIERLPSKIFVAVQLQLTGFRLPH